MNHAMQWADKIRSEIGKAFLGDGRAVDLLLTALLCRGHILLEDVPGVGKTILARAAAKALGGTFSRIQCTPDLLPADILGMMMYHPGRGEFEYHEGPLNANIVLVDEINRATPRTQSALLEAMAEGQVSVDGKVLPLPKPFIVIATQNPVEQEGTFPLPEAQLDRFFLSGRLGYPPRSAEYALFDLHKRIGEPVEELEAVTSPQEIMSLAAEVTAVHAEGSLKDYVLDIVAATRQDPRLILGISPRGSLALFKGAQAGAALRGREYVIPEDVRSLAPAVFWKRVIVDPRHQLKGIEAGKVIADAVNKVPVPVLEER